MSKNGKLPYYLDFERDKNAYVDVLGRKFENSRDIKKSQEELNHRFLEKTTSWSERFPLPTDATCAAQYNVPSRMPLNVSAKNSTDPHYPFVDTSCADVQLNPHSFWGVNDSSRDSVEGMSESYLLMKQAQEQSQLANNAHYYEGLSEEVKRKQALERQRHLESSGNNLIGGNNSMTDKYARIDNGSLRETSCVPHSNAQGEWLTVNPNNYLVKNKYEHLKKLDPDQLNKMMGKPVANRCAPDQPQAQAQSTNWRIAPERLLKLQSLNSASQQKIMKEKTSWSADENDSIFAKWSQIR